VVSPDKTATIGSLSNPMINARTEDSELRLEVWTAAATNVDGCLHGLVLLEGSDLFRHCYKDNDKRMKRPARYCLSSSNPGKPATRILSRSTASRTTGEMASLEALSFLLCPKNETGIADDQLIPFLHAPRNVGHRVSHSLNLELGQILTSIERSTSEPCPDEISKLTEILTSNQSPEVTTSFLTRGGALLLGKRLAEQSTPLDRKNAIKILCGLLRDFSVFAINKM